MTCWGTSGSAFGSYRANWASDVVLWPLLSVEE